MTTLVLTLGDAVVSSLGTEVETTLKHVFESCNNVVETFQLQVISTVSSVIVLPATYFMVICVNLIYKIRLSVELTMNVPALI